MNAVYDPTGPLGVALVYILLGAGVVVALFTVFVQLRRLPQALTGEGPPFLALAAVASGAGMASIGGGALAVSLGGPGALPWIWVATFLGMGLVWLDASLAARTRGHDARGALVASTMRALEAGLEGPGKALALLFALFLALAAISVGALFQGQQIGAVLREVTHARPWAVALLLLAGALPLLLIARAQLRHHVLRVAGWALAIYLLLTLALLLSDTAAVAAALARALASATTGDALLGGAVGGTITAVTHGVLRATMAGATGLGGAALTGELARASDPERAGARAMLAPLISGVVGTLTALTLLAHGPAPAAQIAERELLDLEPHHSRGLLPSERGQTFILPADTPLREDHRYPMVLRASPRGHRAGQLFRDENIVALPAWTVTAASDTVVFRDKDPERAKNPGYDLIVPCERELVKVGAGTFLKLTPRDPALNMRAQVAARGLDGPFIVLDDLHFIGVVERAFSARPQIGEHLALYEDLTEEDPAALSVRDALALGYRGPFFDDGLPALPRALISAPEFTPAIGEVTRVRFTTPERGLRLGFINRIGEIEAPPWDFLAAADTAIFRHRSDPALDLRVGVQPRLFAGRLRFAAADPKALRALAAAADYEGPYLLTPPAELRVEVHSDARLPARYAGRRALIPLDADAPRAGGLVHPGPAALLAAGLEGPVLATDGAGLIARTWGQHLGAAGSWVLALTALALTLSAMAAWAAQGAAAARHLFGEGAGGAFRAVFLVAVVIGPSLGLLGALRLADAAVILAAQVQILSLVFLPFALTKRPA